MATRANYLLSLDAGTTGVTAMAFDLDLRPVTRAYAEFPQGFPRPGWVEHRASDILGAVDATVADVLGAMEAPPAAIGITNQRETVFAIDVESGLALEPGIVWQDRRTAERCRELEAEGHGVLVQRASGLRLDPYFSATKIEWLLGNSGAVEAAAKRGTLRFVTVDALIIHHLTGGESLATDPTNASRTMLVDLNRPKEYDPSLCGLFGVNAAMLPEIQASASEFGIARFQGAGTRGETMSVPITGVLGDQQAALFG
ncbi:MAG: FGGY family carbohydrate kinase, partial [Planctomycetota bacterium]